MRISAILLCLCLVTSLFAIRNWETYTNTTHVFDVTEHDGHLWLATWGGLVELDPTTGAFLATYTNVDGLSSQDVRALASLSTSELLVGTASAGIDRLQDGDFLVPLNTTTGLANDRILDIARQDTMLFVSTASTVSVFTTSSGFPFPLLIDNFAVGSGPSHADINNLGMTQSGWLICQHSDGYDYVHIDSLLSESSWHTVDLDDIDPALDGATVVQMHLQGNDASFATTGGAIVLHDLPLASEHETYSTATGLESDIIYPTYLDANGELWLSYGTWNREELVMDSPDTLAYITHIATDGGMNTWTFEDGVDIPNVMGFFEADGDQWTYTWGKGCYRYSDGEWLQYQPHSISANAVTTMVVDDDGRLWTASGYFGVEPTTTGTRGISMYDPDTDMWESWDQTNSPIHSDNISTMAIDPQGRVWMGSYGAYLPVGWGGGVSIFDPAADTWRRLYASNSGLTNGVITTIMNDPLYPADNPAMYVSCYGSGSGAMVHLNMNAQLIGQSFTVPWDGTPFQNTIAMFADDEIMMFGGYYDGVVLWNDSGIQPYDGSALWQYTPFSALHGSGYVYKIIRQEDDWGREWWVAASTGLYAYNGEDWFKLDIDYKRYIWNGSLWEIYQRYFVNEERLFGSEESVAKCLLTDPFGRVWIGTEDNGITMYDPYSDRYTTYNMANSPLLSNNILSLAYEPRFGRLFIGTPEGLNSVEVGRTEKWRTDLDPLQAAPNPFRPDAGEVFAISNGDEGSFPIGEWHCRLYDIAGELVRTLDEDIYYRFVWDGTNEAGRKCSSGVYFYVVYDGEGRTRKGTVALIR